MRSTLITTLAAVALLAVTSTTVEAQARAAGLRARRRGEEDQAVARNARLRTDLTASVRRCSFVPVV